MTISPTAPVEPPRPCTLVCAADGIWLWPGTPLTERRGHGLAPLPTPQAFQLIAMLHGPKVHPATLARMRERATAYLNAGRVDEARQVVASIPLPPVTLDGDALMRAVGQRLGIKIPAVTVAGYPSSTPPQIIQQLASVYDTKLAAAVMLEAAFNPELCRVKAGAVRFDPAQHPRWPRGQSDGGQFRPRDDAGGGFVPVQDRREAGRASLPPGNYRPELRNLVERIANAAPGEAMALHHAIEQHYGQFGDGFAAAVLHRALSEVLQPGVTAEDRQRIAERIAFLADRNPERIGALDDALGAIVLGQRGGGARTEASAPSEAPEVPSDKRPLDIPAARPTGRGEVSRWGRRIADALGDAVKDGDAGAVDDIERSLAETTWLDSEVANIRSAQNPPQSLDDLKARAREKGPHPGYDDHHIIEQGEQNSDIPRVLIEADDNVVRIPRYKHWLINRYYQMPREDLGWQTPREYLKGRSVGERRRFGLEMLREVGVLQ